MSIPFRSIRFPYASVCESGIPPSQSALFRGPVATGASWMSAMCEQLFVLCSCTIQHSHGYLHWQIAFFAITDSEVASALKCRYHASRGAHRPPTQAINRTFATNSDKHTLWRIDGIHIPPRLGSSHLHRHNFLLFIEGTALRTTIHGRHTVLSIFVSLRGHTSRRAVRVIGGWLLTFIATVFIS